jgi:hypothetical protein
MKGTAEVNVRVVIRDIDLPGLTAFVDYLNRELAAALHLGVNANPGVGSTVLNLTWTPT